MFLERYQLSKHCFQARSVSLMDSVTADNSRYTPHLVRIRLVRRHLELKSYRGRRPCTPRVCVISVSLMSLDEAVFVAGTLVMQS